MASVEYVMLDSPPLGSFWVNADKLLGIGKRKRPEQQRVTTLKTAMLAPMPRARIRIATMVKPRSRPSVRRV